MDQEPSPRSTEVLDRLAREPHSLSAQRRTTLFRRTPAPTSAPTTPEPAGRFGADRRTAAAIVAAICLCLLVGLVLLARRPPPIDEQLPRAETSSTVSQVAEPAAEADTDRVVVHVGGAVASPGVVRLAASARVVDAVDAAGGLRPDADADRINLAAALVDGARIVVPVLGQPDPAEVPLEVPEPAAGSGDGPGGAPLVDVNRATAEELEVLPGVGPATAEAIISHREDEGPFRDVDALIDVRGIGDAKLEALRDLVTVGSGVSDRGAVALALGAVGAAFLAPGLPTAVGVAAAVLALLARQPALVVVAVLVVVGSRAHESLAALSAPLPDRVEGVAELASDPERDLFGARAVLRIDGRRYLAEVDREHESSLLALLTGDRVRVAGRPTAVRGAPEGWLRARHLAGRLQVREMGGQSPTPPWYRVANGVHRTLSAGADSFSDDRRPLYLGLVIGDDRGQSELMEFRFRAAGLTHLLAVSGQNVAFVLAVAAPVLSRLGRRQRAIGAVCIMVLFVLVTRADPSVLRASVMAAIGVLAVTTGRVAPGIRILSVTIAVLLVVDPLLVHSVGFQLSVAATAGLILLGRPIARWLPGPSWLSGPLSVTLAAQLATAPVQVLLFGALPSAATLANLLAGPPAGLVMMSGVSLGWLAGLLRDPFAAVLQLPNRLLVGWVDHVARVASSLPLSPLGPRRLLVVAAGVTGVIGAARSRRGSRWRPARLVALVLGGVCLLLALRPAHLGPGRHHVEPGVTVWVGRCGGAVLGVDGAGAPIDVLDSVWRRGVRGVDVVVAGPGVRDLRLARTVADQLGARRVVSPSGVHATSDEAAPEVLERLVVGGVEVVATGDSSDVPEVRLQGSPCSLAR